MLNPGQDITSFPRSRVVTYRVQIILNCLINLYAHVSKEYRRVCIPTRERGNEKSRAEGSCYSWH